jgi:hypothetical protein
VTRPEFISVLALFVSITSLVVSVFFNLRDRARLVIGSKFFAANPEYGPARIEVVIVNSGRRPVVLRMWGGSDANGEWVGEFLGEEHAGLRLSEYERHDIKLYKDGLFASVPHGEVLYRELWVEDSVGRRYNVKDSRRNVEFLWKT